MSRRISVLFAALLVATPVFAGPRTTSPKGTTRTKTSQTAPSTQAPSQGTTPSTQTPAQPTFGTLRVNATNNGLSAAAQFELIDASGAVVLSGACGTDVTAPTGTFTLRTTLSSAPTAKLSSSVTINAEQRAEVTSAFASGRLSLSIITTSGNTSGIAKVYSGGVEVGSIGNGNQLSLPVGTYNIKVSHNGVDKWFNNISLSSGQLRNISANF